MIAQDSRPTWRKGDSLKPFVYTQGRANLIKDMMQERGITPQQMLERFPNRPSTREEFQDIFAWLKEQGKKAEASTPAPAAQAMLPTGKRGYGYYAIPAGELGYAKPHFFRVKNARNGATQYLDEKAGPDLYPVRGARKAEVMKWLAAHEQEAGALYGQLIGNCRFCHKDLTDEDNPYKKLGAGPDCGPKYMG